MGGDLRERKVLAMDRSRLQQVIRLVGVMIALAVMLGVIVIILGIFTFAGG